ncbi:Gypsy retrotransposon integrase-like protein 1 [Stygiomarasmius scandens]|uniref:Gypsy retrotransposon integrase-like protein 1 n=1 Tax=Marasmiellus scandens TaxID=2682957 RepID=A0ABR1JB55_9AGAR
MFEDRQKLERKTKLPNACDECKRRKIRCDSEIMPNNICSHCINSGTVCAHKRVQQRRGPKPWSVRTAASQPVNTIVTNILAATPSDPVEVPEDKEVTRKIMTKLANRIRELEEELKRLLISREISLQLKGSKDSESPLSTSSPNSAPEAVKYSEETDSVEDLTQQLSKFSFGFPSNTHFGESSNLMLMMAAMDHGKKLHGPNLPDWNTVFSTVKRPEFWNIVSWPTWCSSTSMGQSPPLEFPPQSQLEQFVDAYFVERDAFHILLHRPTFEKLISEGLHLRDDAFGAVVLAICALGANSVSPCPKSDTSADRWISQIRLEKFVFSPKLELYHLQLYCLYIAYLHSTSSGVDLSWLIVGIAIRRSQEKGAHRRLIANSERPTVEGELWKRAFWMLVVIDTYATTMFGRPRAISIQDFDLDPLVECDDEYWEPADSKQAFMQPEGIPSKISYWNNYLKLIEIHGFALLTIYSVRKSELGSKMGIGDTEWYEKAVMELDSALNKWLDSVPEHLKWENQNDTSIFFSQSAILYSAYYWVQIQIHRKFIPRPGHTSSTLSFPSLTICTNAARSCIRIGETYHKKHGSPLYPNILMSLFSSAVVLALNLARSAQQNPNFDPTRDLLDIHRSLELIRLYEDRFIVGGRLVDTINMIMYATFDPARLIPKPEAVHINSMGMASQEQARTTGPNINGSFTFQGLSGSTWAGDLSQSTTDLPFCSKESSELYSGCESLNDNSRSSGSFHEDVLTYTDTNNFGNLPDERMLDTWRNNFPRNPNDAQDWDSFMTGVDQLLNAESVSGSSAFNLFNF